MINLCSLHDKKECHAKILCKNNHFSRISGAHNSHCHLWEAPKGQPLKELISYKETKLSEK